MPLISLYAIPKNLMEWNVFSFNNQDSHNRIITAIYQQKKLLLASYAIDPIPWHSMSDWLRNHQQLHNEMDAILGIESSDLTVPNFTDRTNLEAFILAHADEHRDAEDRLGIS